jgi:hypothetical protein
MTIPIETDIVFGIPLGATKIPIEICTKLKSLPALQGQNHGVKFEDNPELYNVLGYNAKLKNAITEIFSAWINNLSGNDAQKWVMTTNWITENTNGAAMTEHYHTNCMYSAVIYFEEILPEHPPLILMNPLAPSLNTNLCVRQVNANPFNATNFVCPCETGTMIMFPSYVKHGHAAYKSKVNRKSFACNFFPVGRFSNQDSSLDTNWLSYDD